MSEPMRERLLRAAFDPGPLDDELVAAVAGSPPGQAECVELLAVLARLPGDGARAAELRLEQLLDAVAHVAVAEVVAAAHPHPSR